MLTKVIEDRSLMDNLIHQAQVCYVGMIDLEGNPYVLPMNFGYDGESFYLHAGPEGLLPKILEKNPLICLTISTGHELIAQNQQVACSYRMKSESVICKGKVYQIDNINLKKSYLNIMMKHYTHKDVNEFKYSDPALKNVLVWKVEILQITGKAFGVPHENSPRYDKDRDIY